MERLISLPEGSTLEDSPITGYVKIKMPTKSEKTRFGLKQAKIIKEFPVSMVPGKIEQLDENDDPILDESGEPVMVDGHFDENLQERLIEQALHLYEDIMPRVTETNIKYDGVDYKDKTVLEAYDDVYNLFQVEFATKVYGENKLGKKKPTA